MTATSPLRHVILLPIDDPAVDLLRRFPQCRMCQSSTIVVKH